MNISLVAVTSNFGIVLTLFGLKIASKAAAVYSLARRFISRDAGYMTLLLSAGLTFGTIGSILGLEGGIIDSSQFSILMGVILLSAVAPILVAQKLLTPPTDSN